ncbi:MAG TPA: hypothetical protein VEN79_10745, partial [Terriglobia bacterium]|nr:hypothetical protein [Terriglobia bacterium]
TRPAEVTRLWTAVACSAPYTHLDGAILKLRGALWSAAAKLPLWTAGAAAPAFPGAFTEGSRYGDELKAAASRPQPKAFGAVMTVPSTPIRRHVLRLCAMLFVPLLEYPYWTAGNLDILFDSGSGLRSYFCGPSSLPPVQRMASWTSVR